MSNETWTPPITDEITEKGWMPPTSDSLVVEEVVKKKEEISPTKSQDFYTPPTKIQEPIASPFGGKQKESVLPSISKGTTPYEMIVSNAPIYTGEGLYKEKPLEYRVEKLKKEGKTPELKDYAHDAGLAMADHIGNYVTETAEGIGGGIQKVKEDFLKGIPTNNKEAADLLTGNPTKQAKAFVGMLAGAGNATMSALMHLTPVGVAFTEGTKVLEAVIPSSAGVTKFLFAPISSIYDLKVSEVSKLTGVPEEKIKENTPQIAKDLMQIGDIVGALLMLHGAKVGGKAGVDAATEHIVNKLKEGTQEFTPEEQNKIIESSIEAVKDPEILKKVSEQTGVPLKPDSVVDNTIINLGKPTQQINDLASKIAKGENVGEGEMQLFKEYESDINAAVKEAKKELPETKIANIIDKKNKGEDIKRDIIESKLDKETFDSHIDLSQQIGAITEAEATTLKTDFSSVEDAKAKVPEEYKGNPLIVEYIAQKADLAAKKKGLDESFHPEINAKIDEVKNKIQEVTQQTPKAKIEEGLKGLEEVKTAEHEAKREEFVKQQMAESDVEMAKNSDLTAQVENYYRNLYDKNNVKEPLKLTNEQQQTEHFANLSETESSGLEPTVKDIESAGTNASGISTEELQRNIERADESVRPKTSAENRGVVKGEKIKRVRTGNRVPKFRRKIKDPRRIEALKVEADSPRERALQYFIGKGQLHPSAIEALYGNKGGKSVKSEMISRIGLLNKTHGLTIDQIAHKLWEENAGDERYTTQDYRDAVESVINDHIGAAKMTDEILKRQETTEEQEYNKMYNASMGIEPEFIDEASIYWESLSSEEKAKIGESEKPPTDFDKKYNEFENEEQAKITEQRIQEARNKTAEGFDDLLNALGGKKDITGENRPKVIDALKKIAEGLSEELGIRGEELWNKVKEYVKGKIDEAFLDEVKGEIIVEKPTTEVPKVEPLPSGTEKKSLLGRVYEGKTPEEIKTSVENHGLNYNIETHPEAERLAANFVKEVGVDNALQAVRDNQVEGGAAPFVWATAIDAIHKEFLAETNPEAKIKLAEKEATLIDEFDKKARSSGRFSSALQAVYQVSDLGYKLGTILNRAKEANAGENVPDILKARLTDLSEKLDEINKKMAEREKTIEQDTDKAIMDEVDKIVKSIYEKLPTERRKRADKAIAALEGMQEKLRSNTYSSIIPLPIIDAGISVIKHAIKAGVNIADAVEMGINHIKERYGKDWERENDFRKDILDEFTKQNVDLKKEPRDKNVLDEYKNTIKKSIEKQRKRIEEKDFGQRIKKEKPVLDKEGFELLVEKNKLKDEIDLEIEKLKLKNRTMREKVEEGFVDALNLPKSLMASADMSAPLRQGAVLSVKHPIIASKTAVEMFRQAFSEKKAIDWLTRLKSSPEYDIMRKAGLYIAEPTAKLSAKEEQFISNIAHKIPIWGKVVKGSERAYTGYLNKLRVDVFNQFYDGLTQQGIKGEQLNKELESFADFVNNASGRGNLGRFEDSAAGLNAFFFSPRYAVSRFNLLNPYEYYKMSPKARAEALKTVGVYIGMGSTILALASAAGANVNLDPRSSDFGKIKIGDTRFDIWSGFQQWVRLISQLVTGQKTTLSGNVKELGKGYKTDTRLDIIKTFLRYKAAPAVGFGLNVLSGKDAAEKEVSYKFNDLASFVNTEEGKLLIPLYLQDLISAVKANNVKVGVAGALGSFFGMGVQTYNEDETTKIKAALEKQETTKSEFIKNVETAYEEIKDLSKAEQKNAILKYKTEDRKLYDKLLNDYINAPEKLEQKDRLLKQLGVENGVRAEYIFNQTKDMGEAEKYIYMQDLKKKGILTIEVEKQIKKLH